MKATLKQYRQSPRKVRLVADLIRGKTAEQALLELSYTQKRATEALHKLLSSAIANAEKNDDADRASLIVKEITVNEGPTLRRHRPRARGRASRINKRTSHITIILSTQESSSSKQKAQSEKVETEKKEEKPAKKKQTAKKESTTTPKKKASTKKKPVQKKTKKATNKSEVKTKE